MLDDGERILDLVGVLLVLALVAGVGVIALNFDPPASDAPDANWTVQRINDTHVEITHDGGDPIPPEEIRVTADSLERDTDWPDPVVPGASTTVIASEGSLVRVVWNGGRGDRVIMAQKRT
jgi:hypothetical protein